MRGDGGADLYLLAVYGGAMNRIQTIAAILAITALFLAKYARHTHKWERVTIGEWEEVETKYLFDGTDAEPPIQYRWQRKELVFCKCGVTHERWQIVTDKEIRVIG